MSKNQYEAGENQNTGIFEGRQNNNDRIFNNFRKGDIGLIGLAVMGQNLILNMADHGFTVVAFNRSVEKVHAFLANEAKGKSILGAESIPDLVSKLKSPVVL